MKTKRKLSGSLLFKIVVFFLLAFSTLAGTAAVTGSIWLLDMGIYGYGYEQWMYDSFEGKVYSDAVYFQHCIETDQIDVIRDYCAGSNLDASFVRVYSSREVELWSTYEDYNTPFVYKRTGTLPQEPEYRYTLTLYLNPDFGIADDYFQLYRVARFCYDMQIVIPCVAAGCILMVIICFLFLMCGAGHKNGVEGIAPSVLAPIHLDVLTAVFGFVAAMGIFVAEQMTYYSSLDVVRLVLILLFMTLEVVWCTIYCVEVAGRMKRGKWWRQTLVYLVFRGIRRFLRFMGHGFRNLVIAIPMALDVLIVFLGVSILEAIGLLLWGELELVIFWFLEKLAVLFVLLYVIVQFRRLQRGSEALAEGNLDYRLDTKGMVLDFKEHADNLNCIGEGLGLALEERMKSERLKTELITNVSHDIKTPLTSIINYADLLGSAVSDQKDMDRTQLAEYAEVLLRQSKRLKKLLDDLVEASKATTGNLEVHMAPCEINVLLSQAMGEYEQRFEEKNLQLIIRQPEEPVRITADGRHLWRVFDNLLNNIYKYAQENTRVYLTVEFKNPKVEIIFRNMSKYVLDVSGDELEERFVRGDKSRHMEGSGLGLSIAKSLVELQHGTMEIVTDGDLFKVILRFAPLTDELLSQ